MQLRFVQSEVTTQKKEMCKRTGKAFIQKEAKNGFLPKPEEIWH